MYDRDRSRVELLGGGRYKDTGLRYKVVHVKCDTDVLVVMQDLALGKCHAHCMALEVPLFS